MTNDSQIKINGAIARENPYGMLREPTFSGVLSFMRRAQLQQGSHRR